MTPSLGANEAEKGSAFDAELVAVRRESTPEEPKPAKQETTDAAESTFDDAQGSVIELAARIAKPDAAEATASTHVASGLVTVRPKPEKRKNAKERAKEKFAKKTAEDRTTPDTTAKAKSKAEKKAAKAERKEKAKKAKSGR